MKLLSPWPNVVAKIVATLLATLSVCSCTPAQSTQVNFPLEVKREMELSTPTAAVAVAWSPDGSRIAAAIDFGTTIVVWDRSGRKLSQFDVGSGSPNLFGSMSFVDGSSHLLFAPPAGSGDRTILSVRDALSGKVLGNVQVPATESAPTFFAVSPDQRFLAVAVDDQSPQGFAVAIADTHNWTFVRRYPQERGAISLNFFAKSQMLVIGTGRGTVTVLDPLATNPPREYSPFGIGGLRVDVARGVAGSPDGTLIFAGPDGEHVVAANVLRATDGALVASLPLALHQTISAAAWDPKGRYVAFLDDNRALTIWRPLAERLSYETIDVPGPAKRLALAPDGDEVAVAGVNGVEVYSIH